jgi:hypothetical protein
MQPILEIRKLGERCYTYTVGAARMSGEPLPEACYADLELPSIADCLRDAADALTYFPRVYLLYEGVCIGEQTVSRLESEPDGVACELLATYRSAVEAVTAGLPSQYQSAGYQVSAS